jgi:hypothetical protein
MLPVEREGSSAALFRRTWPSRVALCLGHPAEVLRACQFVAVSGPTGRSARRISRLVQTPLRAGVESLAFHRGVIFASAWPPPSARGHYRRADQSERNDLRSVANPLSRSSPHGTADRAQLNRNNPFEGSLADADERTRTSTQLPGHGPEPCASTNSATSAWGRLRRYRTIAWATDGREGRLGRQGKD